MNAKNRKTARTIALRPRLSLENQTLHQQLALRRLRRSGLSLGQA